MWILIITIVFFLARILSRKKTYKPDANVFEHYYLEGKSFYVSHFGTIPSTSYVDNIDISKAFDHINDQCKGLIDDIFQACYFDRQENKQLSQKIMIVLSNKVIVELYSDYARILFEPSKFSFADNLIMSLKDFKLPEKAKDYEINIITFDGRNLELKPLPINPTQLDVDLYFNNDFKEIHELIKLKLSQQKDKGIVLLHGAPGTGKTTYLRHLIGELDKKILFVSPSVASQLMNPEFIDLLIDNPNSILIIEDAENIIMDRKRKSDSSVSNLLNLSDGLLSDCISVQIICTFNSSLSLIDSALLRKGRLIASYEFGKLAVEKAQRLSNHLGLDQLIVKPMTLAEITNPDAKDFEMKSNKIGFSTSLLEN